jgi:outer membrane protein assembly factor BamA
MNLVRPTYISPEYQQALDTNITLARSIEKQFIVGPNYNYNFNTQIKPNIHSNNYFFNANIDVSGNIMGLVSGADVRNGKQKNLFGIPYSQYVRTELDFRHYLRINKKTILASRILGGIGYAYGNSEVLPFMKAFFAGGTNDIRAFRARSLGPGTYYAGNASTSTVALSEQPGDIKLEMNTEMRMKLFSVLYAALFVDAGNIWTMTLDSSRPGSKFSGKFLNEMAVGTGVGLRVDVSFFVLRLDFSIPVRKPFLPDGQRWVLKNIDFGSTEWRKQNLVFNLAIGYPF